MNYKHTLMASYIGYVTQAVANNLMPLLFAAFSAQFGISVTGIGALILVNFGVQILTDLAASRFVSKLGFRVSAVLAHILAFIGLVLMGVLPFVMPAFTGILISVTVLAIGGGLTEVVISPIVQSLPLENKAAHMSFLHSFFCWGTVLCVLLSTLYFQAFGSAWRFLPMLWSLIPLANTFFYMFVPLGESVPEEKRTRSLTLFTSPSFIIMFVIMLCAGASEMAMAQWASYFAELALGVSKTVGDLLGPCSFAVLMGLSRVLFAKNESRLDLRKTIAASAALCIVCYAVAALAQNPYVALVGCTVCGLSVGIMWPGVLSLAAARFENGGGQMFAYLAFAGDIGCAAGPALVSLIADKTSLGTGLLFVVLFPALMLAGSLKLRRK